MGRCLECGKDAGWFNTLCRTHLEEYWSKRDLKYGDRAKVIGGFYAGNQGKVLREFDGLEHRYFLVRLDDNLEINVDYGDIEKV